MSGMICAIAGGALIGTVWSLDTGWRRAAGVAFGAFAVALGVAFSYVCPRC